MDAEDLRALQAPLKDKYKAEPNAAIVRLTAEGVLGEGIACKVDTGKALIEAGLHPATGGDGVQACSGNMLLDALVACAGVTLKAVATAIGFHLEEGRVSAEGDLDFRGTLGIAKEAPVGFSDIRLTFHLKTREPQERIDQLIKLTERYCVVFQTLSKPPRLSLAVAGYWA
ncbi:MAG: OsmC family peroxiredoxin [Rhodospirillales bacterium]|nr:MAG: OsmC family peroxiredoxin [Rhodospirillales bacterium]